MQPFNRIFWKIFNTLKILGVLSIVIFSIQSCSWIENRLNDRSDGVWIENTVRWYVKDTLGLGVLYYQAPWSREVKKNGTKFLAVVNTGSPQYDTLFTYICYPFCKTMVVRLYNADSTSILKEWHPSDVDRSGHHFFNEANWDFHRRIDEKGQRWYEWTFYLQPEDVLGPGIPVRK